jgi:hypothetical protein
MMIGGRSIEEGGQNTWSPSYVNGNQMSIKSDDSLSGNVSYSISSPSNPLFGPHHILVTMMAPSIETFDCGSSISTQDGYHSSQLNTNGSSPHIWTYSIESMGDHRSGGNHHISNKVGMF